MSDLPILKVKWLGKPSQERTIDFEKAKHILPFGSPATFSIILEGQTVNSYDELVQLATEKHHRGRQFLEVVVIAPVVGG